MSDQASLFEVMDAVEEEIKYAQEKWWNLGGNPADDHEIASWILYMEHHLAKARAIASTSMPETAALDEIRKVTALGFRAMMNRGAPRREK